MNETNFKLLEGLISPTYLQLAIDSRRTRENLIKVLLSQRRIPQSGWDKLTIEMFLRELSSMDSNNFLSTTGVGEREARIFSSLVSDRNFGFGHGVGRSGDIAAEQPKAAGSSILQKLSNYLALDALRIAGLDRFAKCIVIPLATGMSISLCLQTLRASRPASAKYVLWPRVDQKTCLKAILTAGSPTLVCSLFAACALNASARSVSCGHRERSGRGRAVY